MLKPDDIPIIFRPDKKGLEKFWGALESQLLEIIWARGPMTVKRALYLINRKNKDNNYAYTTIMTVFNRLCDRGILHRVKQGHSFLYTPVLGRKEYLNFAIENIIASLKADFKEPVFRAFARQRRPSKKKKQPR